MALATASAAMADASMQWIPLESNPDLYTSWSASMGVDTSRLHFEEIYGTDDELLQFITQPVEAVLCLFPVSKEIEARRVEEDKDKEEFVGPEKDGELIWFKQTIGNACGTIGLLHSLINSSARKTLKDSSPLAQLLKDALPLTADQRAAYLQTSKPLAQAHTAAAAGGQTEAPDPEASVDYHFTTFVRHPLTHRLFELDGRRKGPVDRGVPVPKQDDLLHAAVGWIRDNYMALDPSEVNFNLVALTPAG